MPDPSRRTISASQVAGLFKGPHVAHIPVIYKDRIKLGARGCWLWQGARNSWGYGALAVKRKHRGAITPGLTLDHLCRVKHCINPEHMEQVTISENIRRGNSPSARCARKVRCRRGHPFTAENTYRPKRGGRCCRACRRKPNGRGPYARPHS